MKERGLACVLAVFLGGIGAHQYYLGNTKKGLLMTLFSISFIPYIISLYDLFVIASMNKDKFDRIYNPEFVRSATTDFKSLESLHVLKERGAISEEEFHREKQKLIA